MVQTRILFGSLMIAVLLGVAWLDARLARSVDLSRGAVGLVEWMQRGGPTALVAALLALAACRELHALLRLRGVHPPRIPCYIGTVALALIPWIVVCRSASLSQAFQWDSFWTLGALGACFAASTVALLARRETTTSLADLGGALLIVIYVGLLTSFLVRIRVFMQGATGVWVLVAIVLVVKCTDIGAYFTGLLLGRHKMIPWISPKKTWEGAAGGLTAGIAVAVGAWLALPAIQNVLGPVQWLGLPWVILGGVALSAAGQVGDLAESLIKRSVAAKDSAALIPTFGGVLDVLDALLFGAPLAWFLLILNSRSAALAALADAWLH